ncbi:TPA: DUF2188 domain-containing protein [Stenotrophomonas maltophilia]|nr:DUF2188 domain-containing protein [Stenotrophomonas maltophilia]
MRVKFEVAPDAEGGWSVTRDRVVSGTFELKQPAIDYAVDAANRAWKQGKPAQLLIKGKDGRIQEERTNGHDPVQSKG